MAGSPTRSARPRLALALACAGLLSARCGSSEPEPPDERPNVVLMMADDLGWSDLGCYGGEIPTPAIDGLAEAGLRFRDFYTNGLCGPTRASLLYGGYPQQVDHRGYLWDDERDPSKGACLAQLLSDSGYRTGLVGKWQGREHPADEGFEHFFGMFATGPISYYDAVATNRFYLDREPYELPDDFYLTDALGERAVAFLERTAKDPRPFFLYVAFVAPHWPLHAREADVAPHRERYAELGWERAHAERVARQVELGLIPAAWPAAPRPELVRAWEGAEAPAWQAERMAVYAAQVTGLDRAVGRVLAALDRVGAADDTLVAFLSDNGAPLKGGQAPDPRDLLEAEQPGWRLDGGAMRAGSGPEVLPGPADTFAAYGAAWAWVSNAPFRSYKGFCYEGGLRAPLVLRYPGAAATSGGIDTRRVHVFDLYATCLELAAVEPSKRTFAPEGRSLLAALRGEAGPGHGQLAFASKSVALIEGRWKLVAASRRSPWELYDLEADGMETRDLAAAEPERVERMAGAFADWRERVGEH